MIRLRLSSNEHQFQGPRTGWIQQRIGISHFAFLMAFLAWSYIKLILLGVNQDIFIHRKRSSSISISFFEELYNDCHQLINTFQDLMAANISNIQFLNPHLFFPSKLNTKINMNNKN